MSPRDRHDPLERVWRQIFAGDAGPGHVLVAGPDGLTVVAHRPDGGTRTVHFTAGGHDRTVEVPTTTATTVASTTADLGTLADTLEAAAALKGRAALGVGGLGVVSEVVDVTVLGPLDAWLRDQTGSAAHAVAAGTDVACWSCTVTPDPDCPRCAGSGQRRSRGALVVHDASAAGAPVAFEMGVDAAAVDVAEVVVRTSYPGTGLEPRTWTRRGLDLARPAAVLTAAGFTVPDTGCRFAVGDTVVVRDRFLSRGDRVDGLLSAFFALVPAGRAADLRDDQALVVDEQGRVTRRTTGCAPRRSVSEAWEELVALLPALPAPEGTVAEVVLATGFIATGQYGPVVVLRARPSTGEGPAARLVAVEPGGRLEATVETALLRARRLIAGAGGPPR